MKKFLLPLKMLGVTFAIIYLTFCPILNTALVDAMLFHPDEEIDTSKLATLAGVSGQEVTLSNGLTAWLYKVPHSKFIVLFSHGNAGNLGGRVLKVKRLLRCGQSVLIWDYPGFGHSSGTATLKNIAHDAVSVYDYLTGLGYSQDQIVLYGESVGSGVSAELAKQRKVRAIIVDEGFTSLPEIARERFPIFRFYPDFLLPVACMNVREAIH
ncbi:MAG: alpha/beta hydrolase, partial [Terriglobales bacterium]